MCRHVAAALHPGLYRVGYVSLTAQQRTEPEAVLTLLRGKSLAEAGHRSLEKASREADEMAFAEAKSKGTAEAYRVYMSAYPNGRHLNEGTSPTHNRQERWKNG